MDRDTIIEHYKAIHDDLTSAYYKEGLLTKEEFDQKHAQNWLDMEKELEQLEREAL